MGKIKEQLAGVAALIGVLGAIGAGFIKYGEVMSKLDSMEAFNPDPIIQTLGENKKRHCGFRKNNSSIRIGNTRIESK